MFGNSMTLEQLKQLDNFDRIRRGYIDKAPFNFGLIGLTLSMNLFSLNENTSMIIALILFGCGIYVKDLLISKDDEELSKMPKEQNLLMKTGKFLKK